MYKEQMITVLAFLIILTGCGQVTEESGTSFEDTMPESGTSVVPAAENSELARTAYEAFLSGDISLFDKEDISAWGLDTWAESILFYGELEYTYLDLDADGTEELLVQYIEAPGNYNGVFHYENGTLSCWQNDCTEGNCRDYPLMDGTMVRQYDYNGTCSYTLFRYTGSGENENLSNLFAREELNSPDSTEPCPYYEVDGVEVNKTTFDQRLNDLITTRLLDRSAWITL